MKILLIEDEPELRKSVKAFLNDEGNVVESASDFVDARDKIGAYDYDCVLVDVTLPKGSGLDIVKELKSLQPQAGIIIISARGSLEDKVSGLELGADDYLAKPFHLTELNARIKALFRRKNFDGNEVITIKEIKIFPLKRTAFVHNQQIQLTAKEFDLLLYFVSNKNRVVSKSSVAEHLLGDYAERMDSFDFVYAHIKNMRKKIVEKGGTDYLLNVYGIGYNFNVEQ
jgi:DNA-binding response OmpR family regulator